ncbi:MAG TPA: lipopolysaccharide kinase InaA family protein [Thermoanaerobaculia bacterium]|nr:lipopolysaccharide kinase InaA family protein [Thermoanaerobaculia bacterium]
MTDLARELEFRPDPVRHPGRHEVVEAVLRRGGEAIPVVVKKTRTPFFERPGRTRSDRSEFVARELVARGIATPEPLGVAHVGGENWYVARRLEGAVQIREWFLQRDDPARGAPHLRIPFEQVVAALGRLARTMHDRGVFFRDLSDGNVLVTRDGAGFRLWLVDLTRARISRSPVPLWNRLRDLSRPGLNRAADRKLLLESYFAPDPVPASVERRLALFRRRIVFWDDLKARLRPWRRRGGA